MFLVGFRFWTRISKAACTSEWVKPQSPDTTGSNDTSLDTLNALATPEIESGVMPVMKVLQIPLEVMT